MQSCSDVLENLAKLRVNCVISGSRPMGRPAGKVKPYLYRKASNFYICTVDNISACLEKWRINCFG